LCVPILIAVINQLIFLFINYRSSESVIQYFHYFSLLCHWISWFLKQYCFAIFQLDMLSETNRVQEETFPLAKCCGFLWIINSSVIQSTLKNSSAQCGWWQSFIFSRAEYVCPPPCDILDTPTFGRRTFGRCHVRTGRSCFSDDPDKPGTWSATIREQGFRKLFCILFWIPSPVMSNPSLSKLHYSGFRSFLQFTVDITIFLSQFLFLIFNIKWYKKAFQFKL